MEAAYGDRVLQPRHAVFVPSLDLALFALALVATSYVLYLSYVVVFVLGAICPWYVSVAIR
jgi:uncharacterized membrane protein